MHRLTLVLVLLLGSASLVYAGEQEESPILALNTRPAHVGGFLGLGGLWQSGLFTVDCNCNSFKDGGGTQFSIGALYEAETNSSLLFGGQLGFERRSLEARYLLTEDTTLSSSNGSTKPSTVQLTFRHAATVSLSSLFLKPYVKWFPIKPKVFARLGLNASLVVKAEKEFHKTLLTNAVQLDNGDIVSISLDRSRLEASGFTMLNDNEVILQQGSMQGASSFLVSLCPAIGAELRVSKHMFLCPVVEYSLDLTALSSTDTSFKTNALQFFIELHYELP